MGKEMRTKYLRQIFLETWKIKEIDRRAEQELTKYETRKKYSRRNTSTVTEPSTSSTGLNNRFSEKCCLSKCRSEKVHLFFTSVAFSIIYSKCNS